MKCAVVAALAVLAACATPEAGDDEPSPGEFVCTTNAYDLTECAPVEPEADGV